jgi:heme-degrading monooxygenase HmoA
MIERHITFTVHTERTAEFERFFTEKYGRAMARAPGFVRVDLLRELEAPARYQMVLRWENPEAAAGWRTSPAHEVLQPELGSLVSSSEIAAYQVIA